MRWIRAIVAVAALLLATTACGEEATVDESNQQLGAAPASQELSRAPQGPEDGPLPEKQIDASALPEGYPVDITVSDEGATLTIKGQEGGCTKVSASLAEQDADSVAVTLVESKPADKDVMCTMDVRYPPLTVKLDDPLGERTVELRHEQTTH